MQNLVRVTLYQTNLLKGFTKMLSYRNTFGDGSLLTRQHVFEKQSIFACFGGQAG